MISSPITAVFSRRLGASGGRLVRWRSPPTAVSPSNKILLLQRRYFAAATEGGGGMEIPANQQQHQRKPAPPPPLLMVASPENPQYRYFYDPKHEIYDDIRLNWALHLPQIAGHHCIGLSQGFLITIELSSSTKIHATNPLTGATLPSLANPFGPVPDHHPDAPPSLLAIFLFRRLKQLFTGKAILSPSLTTIFFFLRDEESDHFSLSPSSVSKQYSAFLSKISQNDYDAASWSEFESPVYCGLADCIFHKGLLYTLTETGSLATYDPDDPSTTAYFLAVPPLDCPKPWYLLESPQGDDLLLVSRSMSAPKSSTHFFSVFKLGVDRRGYSWNRVRSLGDVALFVGSNASHYVSLSGGQFPQLKPNCIYFTPYLDRDYLDHLTRGRIRQTGVFDLGDGSLRLYQLDDGRQPFDWPIPPVWYIPPRFVCNGEEASEKRKGTCSLMSTTERET